MNRPAHAAFTLLEALIAIVLVAAVLPVALAAIAHVTQGVSRMAKQATAQRLGENQLAQWLVDGSWQTAATSGEFSADTTSEDAEDVTRYHWQLATTAWRDSAGAVKVLTLTVSWEPASDGNAFVLTTLATPPSSSTSSSATTSSTSGAP